MIKSSVHCFWGGDNPDRTGASPGIENENHPALLEAEKQLSDYFPKRRKVFSLDMDFEGTDFQKKVCEALLTIPFLETRTYEQITEQIGSPKAVRAIVGAANSYPISIIKPLHRVIGTIGKFVGFAGGLANGALLLAYRMPLQTNCVIGLICKMHADFPEIFSSRCLFS